MAICTEGIMSKHDERRDAQAAAEGPRFDIYLTRAWPQRHCPDWVPEMGIPGEFYQPHIRRGAGGKPETKARYDRWIERGRRNNVKTWQVYQARASWGQVRQAIEAAEARDPLSLSALRIRQRRLALTHADWQAYRAKVPPSTDGDRYWRAVVLVGQELLDILEAASRPE